MALKTQSFYLDQQWRLSSKTPNSPENQTRAEIEDNKKTHQFKRLSEISDQNSMLMFPNSVPSPSLFSPFPVSSKSRPISRRITVAETGRGREEEEIEIRVCTNRTCRNQGSFDTFRILSQIAPPFVSVNRCGCLSRCGGGPNVVVLPDQVFVGHCGTPFKAAQLMMSFVYSDESVEREIRKCLDALSLRLKGEDLMDNGDFDEAQILLSQAIDIWPYSGVHISYKSRSAARLALGNVTGALEDANEALKLAPKYPEAYLCQGDALMANDKLDAAENSYSNALRLDQSLRRSKPFKARIAKLQERRAMVDSD